MLTRNNSTIRNSLCPNLFNNLSSCGFVILSAAPEDGIFGDFVEPAPQRTPGWCFGLGGRQSKLIRMGLAFVAKNDVFLGTQHGYGIHMSAFSNDMKLARGVRYCSQDVGDCLLLVVAEARCFHSGGLWLKQDQPWTAVVLPTSICRNWRVYNYLFIECVRSTCQLQYVPPQKNLVQ